MRRYKPVLVHWFDIQDGGGEWAHAPSDDPRPVTVRTVGYLKAKNKTHILVARDHYTSDGKTVYGGQLAIPHGVIQKLVSLSEGEGV